MPPELFAEIVKHGAWATLAAVLLYLFLQERKETRSMSKALLEATKEQVTATQQNTAATSAVAGSVERLGEKLDTLISRRSR
jgi:isochorismate synthase EntC